MTETELNTLLQTITPPYIDKQLQTILGYRSPGRRTWPCSYISRNSMMNNSVFN